MQRGDSKTTMSRFGTNDYNPTGSTGSNSSDYKDRDSYLMDKYAVVEVTLDNVGVYEGNYGKSIILNMDDVEVIEGVIGNRTDDGNGEADDKLKVFGWDKWFDRDENMELVPFEEGGEISTDEIGRRVTESAGGDNYKYSVEQGVLEGRDEPVGVGNLELWLSNGKKARTIAKVLSQKGHDIINQDQKRDDREWLNADDSDEFQLRDELAGRRIMFWFEDETLTPDDIDDLDEPVTFTDAVLLDAETEAGITIVNDESDDSGADSDSSGGEADSSSDGDEADSTDEGGEELPADVDELVDMFARTGQDNRDSIENIVTEEAPDDYEVDMDVIMSEISER